MFYKAVRRLPDGRRVSQFMDGNDSWTDGPFRQGVSKQLDYRPNGTTHALACSEGIYCYHSVDEAIGRLSGNTSPAFTGVVEIHIAYPVGPRLDSGRGFPRFEGIRLGETVARHKVVRGIPVRRNLDENS